MDRVMQRMLKHSLLVHYNLAIGKQPAIIDKKNNILLNINISRKYQTLFSSMINANTRIDRSTPSNSSGKCRGKSTSENLV